jgi:hypothetical protein
MHLHKFVNLLFASVLAGLVMGVHYGLGAPPAGVRDNAQILFAPSDGFAVARAGARDIRPGSGVDGCPCC